MIGLNKISFFDKYLIDREYKIIICNKRIDIINYDSIGDFSSKRIVIKNKGGITTVNGDNLVISKMQDNELIIVGDFDSICV